MDNNQLYQKLKEFYEELHSLGDSAIEALPLEERNQIAVIIDTCKDIAWNFDQHSATTNQ